MKLDVSRGPIAQLDTALLVLPWCQNENELAERPAPDLEALDHSLGLMLTRAVTGGDFRARRGELSLLYRHGESGPDRVLLVGTGKRADLDAERLREVGGRAARRAGQLRIAELTLPLTPSWLGDALPLETAARVMIEGIVLGGWRFDELRSEPAEDDHRPPLERVTLHLLHSRAKAAALRSAEVGLVIAEAQNYARELAARPGNIVNPRYLAEEARRLGAEHGFGVTVMDPKAMKRDGMQAVLAVAAGSEEEPRFIAMEYGDEAAGGALVLVGKGVTFDAGGLSLKTPQSMETMKSDMSGAAAVLGAFKAVAELELSVRLVGLIPAVENMPSGRALRPGDVIGSRSRKTIEVVNTDAEGRVILADALSYAARYEPAAMVDIATLTGACVVALGHQASGLMGNDEALIEEIRQVGERTGERVWPLPLWAEYRDLLKSEIADIKNSGGRAAGTISAAMFLREFVGPVPWAHLDIAGTAWAERAGPYQPVGPTGVGVRLFTEWVRGRIR